MSGLSVLFAAVALLDLPQKEQPTLAAGSEIRFSFPDLPKPYEAMAAGRDVQTYCTVSLPDDYTKTGKFPLLVFLDGGRGGYGANIASPRAFAGKSVWIVANFPLFRKELEPRDAWNGLRVSYDDYAVISNSYRAMMDRIRAEIPNLAPEKSVIGGNSNGGHTLAILLSMLDETVVSSFSGYFFIDGGFDWNSFNRTQKLKEKHILYLVAGVPESDPYRKYLFAWTDMMKHFAKEHGMANWRFEVMDGVPHGLHPAHHPVLKDWIERVGKAT